MPWRRFGFRGETVFVRVLETGKPIVHRGLVELRYKLGATKSYRSQRENIDELEDDTEIISDAEMNPGGATASPAGSPKAQAALEPRTEDTIVVYTDGACSGNPGPAGLGVVIEYPDRVLTISEFLGSATNNYAELMAILRALEELKDSTSEAIHLYTDSAWCLGALTQDWKIKANVEVVATLRALIPTFPRLSLRKVAGHSGDPGNEEADRLAVTAVRREDNARKVTPRKATGG